MKAKVTGVSAWQGTPTAGTLDVEIAGRYVDSSGNATVSHYTGVLDVVNKKWVDPQTGADLWLVVQGPDDPPGPRATFLEVLAYGPTKDVRTTYTRKLISSDLQGLIFDYAEPAPVDLTSFGDAPLTMRAAQETIAMKPALQQALADSAQSVTQAQQAVTVANSASAALTAQGLSVDAAETARQQAEQQRRVQFGYERQQVEQARVAAVAQVNAAAAAAAASSMTPAEYILLGLNRI